MMFVLSVMHVVFMGYMYVSSCRCCVLVSVVHPIAILGAVFLLFATTRSVFKSVKVSVVEITKRTN